MKNTQLEFGKENVFSVSGDYGVVNQIEFLGRSYAGESVAPYRIVYPLNIIYTKSPLKANPYGIIKSNQTNNTGIVSTLYAVYYCNDNVLSKYVEYYFSLDTTLNNYLFPLVNIGSKHDMKISDENVLRGFVVFPPLPEQQKIAEILTAQDNVIALIQKQIALLQKQKKAFLQKMFPKKGCNVPEIRFAGFTDAWEQRKVGELAESTYGGGTPNTSTAEYWNGNIPWIQSSDITEHQLFDVVPKKRISSTGLSKSATKLVPENSIAIVTRVGVGKLAILPFSYTTSQDFLSLSNLNIDINFGGYLLYKKMQSELNAVQGSSIKGVTKEELLKKKVFVPSPKEQQLIGTYFKNLDTLITLHQRKLEIEQQKKKALMQLLLTGKVRVKT